jgi:hypothetical protein
MTAQYLRENVGDLADLGYATGLILSVSDLEKVQQIVAIHVSRILSKPISFEELLSTEITGVSDIVKNKTQRILNKKDAAEFLSLVSIKNLLALFPHLEVSNAVDPIKGLVPEYEIYFRIVAPGTGGAASLGHIDGWYDDLYNIDWSERARLKVWLSLFTEAGKNGLLLRPKKSSEGFSYETQRTPHGPRPALINPPSVDTYDFPSLSPGYGVVFESDSVLHLGAPNQSQMSRISLEVSLKSRKTA